MIRLAVLLAALAPAGVAVAQAPAATPAVSTAPAASAAPAYSTQTTIGELLDNPETKAVLNMHIPQVVSHPDVEMGRPYPLNGITEYVPELTPELLAKIDADLAKVQRK